jgi:arylsulfatase A-like enzyme
MVEAPVTEDRPNIVLVILDSLRGDHVDLDLDGTTPNIARLASTGLTFDRAIAAAGWTLPSHVSMMTGRPPSEHGASSIGSPRETLAHGREKIASFARAGGFLPSEMRALGYETFLGSSNVWVGPGAGFSQWFDSVVHTSFPPGRKPPGGAPQPVTPHIDSARLPQGLRRIVPLAVKHAGRTVLESVARRLSNARGVLRLTRWAASSSDKGAGEVISGFAAWLRSTDRPAFALFNLIETHEPHVAPRSKTLGDARAVLDALRYRGPRLHRHNWGRRRIPGGSLERLRHAYRQEVSYADGCVGSILAALAGAGRLERTVVIVASDHGEAFGEGGIVGHGLSLGEQVARTRLVLSGPGLTRTGIVGEPVSLGSLAATVFELAGGDGAAFPAPSLLSDAGWGRARFEAEPPGEYFRPPGMHSAQVSEHLKRPAAAFYLGSFKLVSGGLGGRALYDVAADPEESHDLLGELVVPEELLEMEADWQRAVGNTP